ncbi:MAG: histidinol-phosphate transaminase [Alphaproteobacteria bacterium]
MSGPIPRPGILEIEAYQGGKSSAVSFEGKLSSNESALGTSPKAREAFGDAAAILHRYPDGGSLELRKAIAAHHGLETDRIVCGFGSDDLLQLMCRGYAGPGDEVLYSQHGFLVYPIAAQSVGATPVAASDDGYVASVDSLLDAVTEKTKLLFLANPNNPTGTYLTSDELTRLHAGLPDHVALVVDGAYAEYVDADDYDSGLDLAREAPNVLMTRTFSKIYGLAALRLGWAYGPEDIIGVLNRLRGPFNVSLPAQAAGVAALEDQAFVDQVRTHTSHWREWLRQRIRGMGLSVVRGSANFLLINMGTAEQAAAADEFLREQGWYLRRMDAYGFPEHLRLTVGTEDENHGVTEALVRFLEQGDV